MIAGKIPFRYYIMSINSLLYMYSITTPRNLIMQLNQGKKTKLEFDTEETNLLPNFCLLK